MLRRLMAPEAPTLRPARVLVGWLSEMLGGARGHWAATAPVAAMGVVDLAQRRAARKLQGE